MGYLDLVGLDLFGHRDGDGQHPVVVIGGDVLPVEALTKEQLTTELPVAALGHLDLVALSLM